MPPNRATWLAGSRAVRIRSLVSIGLAGITATALVAMTVSAQDRARGESPQRAVSDQGEVQITLRPLGGGQFEVLINGERVEGRVGERLVRALQEGRGDGQRRGMAPEGAAAGERPMRGRDLQGDLGDDERRGGPPGAERPETDRMPPFRQRVGQYFEGQVPELTEELLEEVLSVIADFDEALHARLTASLQSNPEVVKSRLRNDLRRWMSAVELKRNDPDLYELNVKDRRYSHETARLVGAYHAARRQNDAGEAEIVRQQLERLVGDHFDVRQKLRERDLAQLEQRLEFLRQQVQQRLERRTQIVAEHVDELLGGPAGDF